MFRGLVSFVGKIVVLVGVLVLPAPILLWLCYWARQIFARTCRWLQIDPPYWVDYGVDYVFLGIAAVLFVVWVVGVIWALRRMTRRTIRHRAELGEAVVRQAESASLPGNSGAERV